MLQQFGPDRLPTYYFPSEDVRMDVLEPVSPEQSDEVRYWHVKVGQTAERAGWEQLNPPSALAPLKGNITFVWQARRPGMRKRKKCIAIVAVFFEIFSSFIASVISLWTLAAKNDVILRKKNNVTLN